MVNKVILIGRLGFDPEISSLPSGTQRALLNLATNEYWVDKQTNQRQTHTEWHRVVCWNKLADLAGKYLKKGAKIFVEGKIRSREYVNPQTNVPAKVYEIIASDFRMLDSPPSTQQQTVS